ncbi:uncharacterized protein TNCV_4995531 [Trichonephila clavipes]|nr:uncharacterized protein TNCV_4995531 [Trichonephila clavipes]
MDISSKTRGHETTPLRMKGDMEDVSSELDNRGLRLHFLVEIPIILLFLKGCAAFLSRRESITGESLTSFPEEGVEESVFLFLGKEMIRRFLNGETNWALKSQCGICAPPEELLILQMTVTIPFVCGRRKYALSACVYVCVNGLSTFGSCGAAAFLCTFPLFSKMTAVSSIRGQVAAVAECYRYRMVACLVTSLSPVPLKTRRVGQRCTLNLSRAETSSRWCGVVVRRGGGVPAQVSSTSLDHGSKLRGPSPKALV